ncbi:hypothetical protein [Streptomyces cyaneofuscatus]|uniref:hypothetical protein n=1 Tax=Streptomyces cyaneofuscatus TaxID=66883 RepID=UPI00365C8D82
MSGQVQAQRQAGEAAVQAAYSAFIRHSQVCAPCRKTGADCADAVTLRQAWRDARAVVAA